MAPSHFVRSTRAPFASAPVKHVRCAAFTLIELLVTIGILAIVAGTVIVAFDDAGSTAGDDLTRQRMAVVREALLKFRADMGYFPGEGSLAADKLDLTNSDFDYVDGDNPLTANSTVATRRAWADHRMNLWQLMQRPADPADTVTKIRWKWDLDMKRGWNGPYLGAGFHFRLDDAGAAIDFMGGARSNRLIAIADAFERNTDGSGAYLRWNNETGAPPTKNYLRRFGRPLIFERQPATGFPATFTLVSMGPDGLYDGPLPATWKDDLRLEVGREGN